MTTGVVVVDRRGKLAALNPSAEALLGVRGADVAGQPLEAATREVEGLRDLVAACLERGRSATREVLEVRRPDGRGAHLGVAVSPASAGPAGEVAGALVLMTDLTEIRRLQEQARTRDNLAAVGQLAAGIAHEFRNALGTILGWARMLEKKDDPRVRGPAQEIVKEVDAVRASLDEFLLYARPQEPARLPVDLDDLVRRCVASAPEGLGVDADGEFGTVVGDEALLRRVFGNLLQNAADAGREAGRPVSVRIVGRRSGSGRHVQIDVEDDGPGIPPERRRDIFVPFFTTRAKGTGLGLALVQRTLVDLGGSVEVGEGPRGGASFRIRLPLHDADPPV
jgi:PAS domain S-box-containing protein